MQHAKFNEALEDIIDASQNLGLSLNDLIEEAEKGLLKDQEAESNRNEIEKQRKLDQEKLEQAEAEKQAEELLKRQEEQKRILELEEKHRKLIMEAATKARDQVAEERAKKKGGGRGSRVEAKADASDESGDLMGLTMNYAADQAFGDNIN